MTTWDNFKENIQAISTDEMTIIDTLSALQAERIRQGLSQKDLATRIGMPQPQLAKIERLDSTPTLTTLNRYAQGLGLEVKLAIVSA
jgi:transcriptional regulator with XRE-family HTH domain